jgi:hypothetical protein
VVYRLKISGLVLTVCIRWLSLELGLGVALVLPTASQSLWRLTGDYVCAYGCRVTDANPSIVVKGGEVDCVNEYGELFQESPLAPTAWPASARLGGCRRTALRSPGATG